MPALTSFVCVSDNCSFKIVIINAYNILFARPEELRPLVRHKQKWDGNTIIDLKQIDYEVVDWIHIAEDRVRWWAVMNRVINLQVP
jgi:hypothetical protein